MQAALIAPIASELYSRSGIVQGQLLDGSGAIGFPRIGHLVDALSRFGVGESSVMWNSLMLPEYRRFDFSWLAHHAWIAVAAGWMVLLVEIGYPFFIWPRRTRRFWVAATVGLHIGIAVFMRLDIFGAIMSVFTIAAFGVKADPRQARAPSAVGALQSRTGSVHDVIGSSER
ncbi:hypothetical protein AB3662_11095 [Sorangium cellulosum]|uniref:hypothetical protein n=1 Tax=Sorangium cellulosum TaxID=56 RepID=UPI003D9A26FA